jgi:hypothetical protein
MAEDGPPDRPESLAAKVCTRQWPRYTETCTPGLREGPTAKCHSCWCLAGVILYPSLQM